MGIPSISQLFDLRGKVAVVTGGAGGIGRAIVSRLAEAGAQVVVADLNFDAAQETAREIEGRGDTAYALKACVGGLDGARALVAAALAACGGLDILVNCAGGALGRNTKALDTDESSWDHVLDVNLRGAFFCSQVAAKEMIRAGRGGRIVNIASIASFKPQFDMVHYSAAKAAVVSMTQSLAKQLAIHDILVNAVAPGGVITQHAAHFLEAAGLDVNDTQKRDTPLTANISLGRWGDPDEIARIVLVLASRASEYMTGSTVLVDGGYLLM